MINFQDEDFTKKKGEFSQFIYKNNSERNL